MALSLLDLPLMSADASAANLRVPSSDIFLDVQGFVQDRGFNIPACFQLVYSSLVFDLAWKSLYIVRSF